MRNPSKITTVLDVDDALAQTDDFEFDSDDRQFLDNQIRGIQKHLVACLIRGVGATFARLSGSSSAVAAGDTVCLASLANATEVTVTKSSAAALLLAGGIYGVVLTAAAPGSFVLVATSGAVNPTLTGLAAAAGAVRVNTTTWRCEKVTILAASDYPVGMVDGSGWLAITRPTVGATVQGLAVDYTNATTGAVASNLAFAVKAGESWAFEFCGTASCSGAAGSKYQISASAALTLLEAWLDTETTTVTTLSRQRISAANALTGTAVHTGAGVLEPVRIRGSLTATADGVVSIAAASVTAAQITTIKALAELNARKLLLV